MSYLFNLFYSQDEFSTALVFLVRSMTKNFLLKHSEYSINGLPLDKAPLQENIDTLERYTEQIVVKMGTDA